MNKWVQWDEEIISKRAASLPASPPVPPSSPVPNISEEDSMTTKMVINPHFAIDEIAISTETSPIEDSSWKHIFGNNLFKNGELSDLKIVCKGKEFSVHKLILSMRSDVFKAMISSESKFKEKDAKVLELEDDAEAMEKLLRFIYIDEIGVEDVDCSLLMLADKYNVKILFKKCLEILRAKMRMNTVNVMEVAITAYQLNDESLLKYCSGWQVVKDSEFWQDLEKVNKSDKIQRYL